MIVRRFFKVFCQGFSEVLAGLHQKTNTYQFTMQARKCCRVACRQLIFLGRKIRRFSWQMIQGHWQKLCALTKYLQLTCRLNPVHDLVLSAVILLFAAKMFYLAFALLFLLLFYTQTHTKCCCVPAVVRIFQTFSGKVEAQWPYGKCTPD